MITAGVDIGSTTGKIVVLNGRQILGQAIIPTEPDSVKTSNELLRIGLERTGIPESSLKYVVATGYGRVNIPYAKENITEISCHAKGANCLFPSVRTILDMGGQDCKAIRCNSDGHVIDYSMNDKCAAGTGRFLEIIAETLDVPLGEIGPLSLEATEVVSISSVCAVFAKNEIVSLMRKGVKKATILSSLFDSITARVMSLVSKVGIEPEFIVTGGIAHNSGIIHKIQKELGSLNVIKSQEAQIVGALGAALFARERMAARER